MASKVARLEFINSDRGVGSDIVGCAWTGWETGMHDSEKLELAIYRYVDVVGVARPASISDFVNSPGSKGQFVLIVQRLQDLRRRRCIALFKFINDARVSYETFANFEGESAFFSGHFEIEIEPGGRKFFEELESRDQQGKQSRLVFISCGQFLDKEKALGKVLPKRWMNLHRPTKGTSLKIRILRTAYRGKFLPR